MTELPKSSTADVRQDDSQLRQGHLFRFWGSFVALPSRIYLYSRSRHHYHRSSPHRLRHWQIYPLPTHSLLPHQYYNRSLFTLGSGIAGGAKNPAMLIAGRTVEGIGAGGIYVLLDIVCADLAITEISYFLPIYFQAMRGTTVLRSGICFLPFAIGTLVFAVMAGIMLSKFSKYWPLHKTAFALSAIGFGIITLNDRDTVTVAWVFFELIASAGAGIIMSVLLPTIIAALPESDAASAAATYSFIRTFGGIWGVRIPSTIFNAVVNGNLSRISLSSLRD
ncbi:hypothetical protein PISL3812_01932 [Talaromyces islandicus]|uniref:Major facilitator superfamily (MFS) profile domain-containing protein n=1 Tax=Talaromyces islandicus TaxID=28573 RepID=A0A0U1LQX1_TALIS|nr:hypothetical protein PISL3812_01932 [Talaromyces islandicus]